MLSGQLVGSVAAGVMVKTARGWWWTIVLIIRIVCVCECGCVWVCACGLRRGGEFLVGKYERARVFGR